MIAFVRNKMRILLTYQIWFKKNEKHEEKVCLIISMEVTISSVVHILPE